MPNFFEKKIANIVHGMLKPSLQAYSDFQKKIKEYEDAVKVYSDSGKIVTNGEDTFKVKIKNNEKASNGGLKFLQISDAKQVAGNKKRAVIYLGGNGEFSGSEANPDNASGRLYKIQNEIKKRMATNDDVNVFMQDYRGRGFNEQGDQETYSNYSIKQDAQDQAAFIKYLVEVEGYQPEDILLDAHSIGGNVALWAKEILCEEDELKYSKLKVYCDRTYGALNDFPLVNLFIHDNSDVIAYLKSDEVGLLPEKDIWKVAAASETFVFQADKDKTIHSSIRLLRRFKDFIKKNDLKNETGSYQKGKAYLDDNPHNLEYSHLSTGIPGVTHFDLMSALMTNKTIVFDGDKTKNLSISRDEIRKNYINVLNDYCASPSESAKDKQSAKLLIQMLSQPNNWMEQIEKIHKKFKKGGLGNIVDDMYHFIQNEKKGSHPELANFNRWLVLQKNDLYKKLVFSDDSFDNIKNELYQSGADKWCKTDIFNLMTTNFYDIFLKQVAVIQKANHSANLPPRYDDLLKISQTLLAYLKEMIETNDWPDKKLNGQKIDVNGKTQSVSRDLAKIYQLCCEAEKTPSQSLECFKEIAYLGMKKNTPHHFFSRTESNQAKVFREGFEDLIKQTSKIESASRARSARPN